MPLSLERRPCEADIEQILDAIRLALKRADSWTASVEAVVSEVDPETGRVEPTDEVIITLRLDCRAAREADRLRALLDSVNER